MWDGNQEQVGDQHKSLYDQDQGSVYGHDHI